MIVARSVSSIEITFLHTNDFHAHFEQFNIEGDTCTREEAENRECYGGVARMVTKVKEMRKENPSTILVDAGDQLQGSNWFYQYEGSATAYFLNKIGFDAMAISNHEFDGGLGILASYLNKITFPVVSCNIVTTQEPILQGLFTKSTTLRVGGERFGIVGYTTSRANLLSTTGNLVFEDEIDAIRREVNKLLASGLNKIIVIGTADYTINLRIANEVHGVDIVAGADPFTLRTRGKPNPTDEQLHGHNYPTVIRPEGSSETVLVVQVQIYFMYIGYLKVTFDEEGRITHYSGKPIPLDWRIQQDPETLKEIEEWAKPVRKLEEIYIGETYSRLEGESAVCRVRECNLGNLIADSMVSAHATGQGEQGWSDVSIALMVSGGIRDSIEQEGLITKSNILRVLPYANTVDMVELKGRHILEAMERSVEKFDTLLLPGFFLQHSGLIVTYDLRSPPRSRVQSVQVLCTECTIPKYEPLDLSKSYKVVLPSYLANGGDGYAMISDNKENHIIGKFLL
ncbi:5'-nucleotidase [Holothuria leucospilota]|uniref:5'-nucleotidase n=1 Tax=Holothuria leucospilota TaxID=206669 RepID=A0A9Q0YJR7_HOLLE|nr:5'-nucleotidase [Holothuria leucospilota]